MRQLLLAKMNEASCTHLGRLHKSIPAGWINCGCGAIRLHKCRLHGDLTIERQVNAEAAEWLAEKQDCRRNCAACQAAGQNLGLAIESDPARLWRWISEEQFVQDVRLLSRRLPWPIRGVAGIPRGGMISASIIASLLNVPLYAATLDRGLVALPSVRQYNIDDRAFSTGPIVVVDDDTWMGRTMRAARSGIPGDVVTAACYSKLESWQPDIVLHRWATAWICEHRFCAAPWFVEHAAWDFDGIFCEDCPVEDDDDGPRYRRFLQDTKRLWIPRPHSVPLVATARRECYRAESEAWLTKHGVTVKTWAMGSWPSLRERTWEGVVRLKADAFARSELTFFVESCPHQAEAIAKQVPKPVICPPANRIFNADKCTHG